MRHRWRITGRTTIETDHFRTFDGVRFERLAPLFTVHFKCSTCGTVNASTHRWMDGAWTRGSLRTSIVCNAIDRQLGLVEYNVSLLEDQS